MLGSTTRPSRRAARGTRNRTTRPQVEALEGRQLLYATLGGAWTYGSRITYSFVPDGTNVAGSTSTLNSTLNAVASPAVWQQQFQQAAALWSSYAHINMVQVSDNGATLAGPGNQQGDPNFGDIRISMIPLATGTLAVTFAPPPMNGGSLAGDMIFNSTSAWGINYSNNVDLESVALHEFGHALGLDHSALSTAVMYAYYNGVNQYPTSDDTSGIQAVYGAYPADSTTNHSFATATNVSGLIGPTGQIALSNLSLAGPTDQDFFYVTVPNTVTNGQFSVVMQTANLSSGSPRLTVSDSLRRAFAQNTQPNVYGGLAGLTLTGVTPGQSFYFRAMAASSPGAYGTYGLLFNFGTAAQPPIAPPITVVTAKSDLGGGSMSMSVAPGGDPAMSLSVAGPVGGTSGGRTLPTTLAEAVDEMNSADCCLSAADTSSLATIQADATLMLSGLADRGETGSDAYHSLVRIVAAANASDPEGTHLAIQAYMGNVVRLGSLVSYGDALSVRELRAESASSAGGGRHATTPDALAPAGEAPRTPGPEVLAPWVGTDTRAHDSALEGLGGLGFQEGPFASRDRRHRRIA